MQPRDRRPAHGWPGMVLGLIVLLLPGACGPPPARSAAPVAAPTEPRASAAASGSPVVALPPPAPETVRSLSSETSVNHSVYYFGAESGIYRQHGLDVQLSNLPPDAAAIILAGHAEFMTTGTGTESAAIKGLPIRMTLVTVGKPNFGVYARPELATIAQLRGKTIWDDNDLLRAILVKHGLEPDVDVSMVRTRTNDPRAGLQAVEQGVADAVFGWPPMGALARRQGLAEVFFAANEIPEVPVSGIGTTERLMTERPDLVKRFIAGTLETMRYMREPGNREEVIAHYQRRWSFDRDLAEDAYAMLDVSLTPDGKVSEQARRDEVELVKRATGITADVPISQVWDFRLLDEVLQGR
jgi:ABC-type nitrate/sulfonate/bicarbonate transport system substrate-binding protein